MKRKIDKILGETTTTVFLKEPRSLAQEWYDFFSSKDQRNVIGVILDQLFEFDGLASLKRLKLVSKFFRVVAGEHIISLANRFAGKIELNAIYKRLDPISEDNFHLCRLPNILAKTRGYWDDFSSTFPDIVVFSAMAKPTIIPVCFCELCCYPDNPGDIYIPDLVKGSQRELLYRRAFTRDLKYDPVCGSASCGQRKDIYQHDFILSPFVRNENYCLKCNHYCEVAELSKNGYNEIGYQTLVKNAIRESKHKKLRYTLTIKEAQLQAEKSEILFVKWRDERCREAREKLEQADVSESLHLAFPDDNVFGNHLHRLQRLISNYDFVRFELLAMLDDLPTDILEQQISTTETVVDRLKTKLNLFLKANNKK